MARTSKTKQHLIGDRVASARTRTEKVQEDIQRAEAELQLAASVIQEKLSEDAADASLAQAVSHTEVVEEKLHEAHEKLKVVTELLDSEERDRKLLETALAECRDEQSPAQPGARTGAGSASVIEHLRELTRHKLNTDGAEAPRQQPKAGR